MRSGCVTGPMTAAIAAMKLDVQVCPLESFYISFVTCGRFLFHVRKQGDLPYVLPVYGKIEI